MATVYKRGGTYWVRFQWRGQEIRKSARTASKAEAQRYLGKLQADAARIDRGGAERRSYEDAMQRFIDEHLPTMQPSAAADYISCIRILTPHFKGKFLDEISRGSLAEFIRKRRLEKISSARIKRNLACLSSMFSCAVSWEWAADNPVKVIDKRGLKEPPGRQRYFMPDEMAAIIAGAREPLASIVRVAIGTGMRMGEILALEHRDVSADAAEIRVRTSKTGRPRTCVATADAIDALSAQSRHISSPLIFRRTSGKPLTSSQVSRWFGELVERLKIKDARFHDLRHTYASERAREGHDLFRIGQQLGHRAAQTTARYSHLRTEDLHTLHGGSARKPAQS